MAETPSENRNIDISNIDDEKNNCKKLSSGTNNSLLYSDSISKLNKNLTEQKTEKLVNENISDKSEDLNIQSTNQSKFSENISYEQPNVASINVKESADIPNASLKKHEDPGVSVDAQLSNIENIKKILEKNILVPEKEKALINVGETQGKNVDKDKLLIKDNELSSISTKESKIEKNEKYEQSQSEILPEDSNKALLTDNTKVTVLDATNKIEEETDEIFNKDNEITTETMDIDETSEMNSVISTNDITKESLQMSENAQLPSFTSKENSQEALVMPTLSESLKKAVSSDSHFTHKFSAPASMDTNEDKKNEPTHLYINTPAESFTDTPYESGETSPSTSTPADSCQVSAAASPLPKDYSTLNLPETEDESSKDTRLADETMDDKEISTGIVRRKRGRKRRAGSRAYLRKKTKPVKQKRPVILDEDTRMSASGNYAKHPITDDFQQDDDSQSSVSTVSRKKHKFRSEVVVPDSTEVFTADKVIEYMWPLDSMGEHFFIQEHIARYLGITSFKRKYRHVKRRPIESEEKEYLRDRGIVSEIACDLGLTAVRSEEVLDILFNDFPSKYEELQKMLRERKEKQLKEKGKVDYQVANLDKSKMKEYSRKAALNAARWNIAFNRDRRDERRQSFDLQTFTLHVARKNYFKVAPESSKMGSYPIAVLPGQFTDFCKSYSGQELKCYPLQTVLNGPYTAEEAEMQAVDSDNESNSASIGTFPDVKEELPFLEEPQAPLPVDPMSPVKQPRCKVCSGGRDRNKDGKPEPLIICGTCRSASHPTCIDLSLVMINKIESYSWQCMECKMCVQCNDPDDEEKMIFCDMCDRGYHIYCVGLRRVPNGRWHCKECAVCFTCGSRTPSGNENIKNAEWQHEFKREKFKKQSKYVCTLCVPCDKYWKRRQFCSVCIKVYRSIPEDGMVRCTECPKYVHKDGCSLMVDNDRYCNNCYKSRNKTALNHSRIIAAAKKKMALSY